MTNPFFDDNKAPELLSLATMFALEDTRLEGDHIAKRHQPAFPLAEYTTCELCNQPLHRLAESPTGWGVTIWRT